MIKMKNVCKTYTMGEEKIKALDNVSLTIEKGEFLSIIGPSGSRKINFNEYDRSFRYPR
jgi:putative ABC transport system ATP-binding protein